MLMFKGMGLTVVCAVCAAVALMWLSEPHRANKRNADAAKHTKCAELGGIRWYVYGNGSWCAKRHDRDVLLFKWHP